MASETHGTRERTKYYLHCLVMVILYLIVSRIAPFGAITPLGMQVLGIFIAVLYGWCTLGLLWPSLFAIILLGCTEYSTFNDVFIESFGNYTVLVIIVIFTFAAYLEESGLSRYMANWFISRKIGEGRPWVFTALIFAATFVLSSFIGLYAAIVIIWGIFYNICDAIGEERKSSYSTMVVAAVVIISSLTGIIFPFSVFSPVVVGLVTASTGMNLVIEFIPWFLYNFIISVTLTVVYLLVAKYIMRPDVSKVKEAGAKYAYMRGVKMDSEQKTAMIVLIVFVVSQLIPSFLPKTIPFVAVLKNLGIIGGAVACLVALAVLRTKDNKPIVNIGRLINKGTSWDIVILMAATMPLSSALESEKTGILTTVIDWMTVTFSGLSAGAFLIVVVILFLLTTQLAHNMVLMVIFIPVLAKLGLNYGIHPFVITNLIYFAAQSAFLLPASSSQAAMIYGNTEWVSTKYAYMYNISYILIAFIVLTCVGIPLAQFFFH